MTGELYVAYLGKHDMASLAAFATGPLHFIVNRDSSPWASECGRRGAFSSIRSLPDLREDWPRMGFNFCKRCVGAYYRRTGTPAPSPLPPERVTS